MDEFSKAQQDAPVGMWLSEQERQTQRDRYFFNAGLAKGRKEGMEEAAEIFWNWGFDVNLRGQRAKCYDAIRQAAQGGEGGE